MIRQILGTAALAVVLSTPVAAFASGGSPTPPSHATTAPGQVQPTNRLEIPPGGVHHDGWKIGGFTAVNHGFGSPTADNRGGQPSPIVGVNPLGFIGALLEQLRNLMNPDYWVKPTI